MIRRRLAATAFALGWIALVRTQAPAIGRFDIKPVSITFARGETSASVEITNDANESQELEIAVRSWTRSDGSDDGEATDDVVASPSIFIVGPGQTQLIRLGPTREFDGDIERTYRLVATEVPGAAVPATLQTILRMRLPVFIAPRTVVAPPLAWHVARNDPAHVLITTRNDGNVHRRIRSLRITASGRIVFDDVVGAYVLAHQSRQWLVPFAAGETDAPLRVRATEMDGATAETSLRVR